MPTIFVKQPHSEILCHCEENPITGSLELNCGLRQSAKSNSVIYSIGFKYVFSKDSYIAV